MVLSWGFRTSGFPRMACNFIPKAPPPNMACGFLRIFSTLRHNGTTMSGKRRFQGPPFRGFEILKAGNGCVQAADRKSRDRVEPDRGRSEGRVRTYFHGKRRRGPARRVPDGAESAR